MTNEAEITIPENCAGDCSVVVYDKKYYEGQRVDTYACERKTDYAACAAEVADFYQNRDYPQEGQPSTLHFIPGLSDDAAWYLKVMFHSTTGMQCSRDALQEALLQLSAAGGKRTRFN